MAITPPRNYNNSNFKAKYLKKIDLGNGQYRYLYTPEEVAAYGKERARQNQLNMAPQNKSGDTSSRHYQYQRGNSVYTGTNGKQPERSVTGTRESANYRRQQEMRRNERANKQGQLMSSPSNRATQNTSRSTYQTSTRDRYGNKITTTHETMPTGRERTRTIRDRSHLPGMKAAQLRNAPQNNGGASSSEHYRYQDRAQSTTKRTGKHETTTEYRTTGTKRTGFVCHFGD